MHLKKITSAIIAIILSFAMLQVTSEPSMAQEVSSANQMPGSNHFYYYLPGSYSWQSAHDSAVALTFRGMQGHLANVTSSEENNFIASFAGRGWLGAKRDPAQTFRWVDGPEAGNSLTYSSWCPGEPNNWGGGEPYVETSGCWNDNGGHGEQFGAIVEFEPEPDPIQMPGTNHYYRFVSSSGISWDEAAVKSASQTFQDFKGHLATIQSKEEDQFIYGLTRGVISWLGGGIVAPGENTFAWLVGPDAGKVLSTCSYGFESCSSNPKVFSNWNVIGRQPDARGEDKVAMAGAQWDDYPNQERLPGYVIEFESLPQVKIISATSGDGIISIKFDTSEFDENTKLQARTTDGSGSCDADTRGVCELGGLKNFTSYNVETRASSSFTSTAWKLLTKTFIPHSAGLQMWFDDNNLKIEEATSVHVLGAPANTNIWVKVGANPKFEIRTDEDGLAATTIWLSKNSSAKVAITSGKTTISKYLYSPKL
ncbi:MAG: hypothetical protein EBT86_11410, partial [Actinobacteria bacterium]|nr:hypothetical protein [Actinomycetota bacterium]